MLTAGALIPSASVVLLRERDKQLEILLLKKNANITFGGSWVFPGGRVDPADCLHLPSLPYHHERNTAIRECLEETGLTINSQQLLPISQWITPVIRPKRFITQFFLYNANELHQDIIIDNGEIVDAKWAKVYEAIKQHNQRDIVLAGPAFVTLSQIAAQDSLTAAINFFSQRGRIDYTPRIHLNSNGAISLYQGDGAYDLLNDETASDSAARLKEIESAKHQHRLYMHKTAPWSYINTLAHHA